MTENSLNNDRFPTDPYLLLLVLTTCASLAMLLPTDRVQSFAGLVALVLPYIPGRR